MVHRLVLFMALVFAPLGAAHDAAPPAQLAGVKPCVQTSSVQLGLEDVPKSVSTRVDAETIRRDLYSHLIGTFARLKIPHSGLCPESSSFVLFGIYARFLDPESYVGFPASSYTYLTTGQLGTFSPQPTLDTALTPLFYGTSSSEIFQAPTATALSQQLTTIGQSQIHDFLRHWLEANRVPRVLYALFGALGAALLSLRFLPQIIR